MWMVLIVVAFVSSCSNTAKQNQTGISKDENKILQKDDGTISLNLDKADCYSDILHPSSNTAEWNVVVSKSGRYNVWLSSAAKDTNDLHYNNAVMFSLQDKRLQTHPECDKVVHNSSDVSYPYFRADSFMGSLYIQDTGLYNIQVISDKIVPQMSKGGESSALENTKLLSVFLTPTTK